MSYEVVYILVLLSQMALSVAMIILGMIFFRLNGKHHLSRYLGWIFTLTGIGQTIAAYRVVLLSEKNVYSVHLSLVFVASFAVNTGLLLVMFQMSRRIHRAEGS